MAFSPVQLFIAFGPDRCFSFFQATQASKHGSLWSASHQQNDFLISQVVIPAETKSNLTKLTVSWGHQYPGTIFPLHFALKPLTNIFDNANMFAVSQSWCLIPSLPFWFKKLQISLTWEFMMQQRYLAREQTQSNSPHFSHKACLVASCSQTFSANPATSPASFQNAIAGLRQHL